MLRKKIAAIFSKVWINLCSIIHSSLDKQYLGDRTSIPFPDI
ncbi:hypothetical protein [Synechocystis sp. PCC 7509]|nr:hypothetical protein [Synechocystis sp. PCC 7509]